MANNNRQPFVNKEGRGALFRSNDTSPKAPGHRGRCTIGGVVYLISAWVETSQGGNKYLNLKFDEAPDDEQPNTQSRSHVNKENSQAGSQQYDLPY